MQRSPALLVAAALIAFLGVVAFRSGPADPEARLPKRYKLVDLIEHQQASAAELRREVARLRSEVDVERRATQARTGGTADEAEVMAAVTEVAGLSALQGPGLKITLDDSSLREPPPGGTVNDLVIHSQDVQAVVNAVWRAGAEAVSINGQRLVSTSAVLCVGNTLLLNGTVHSPPYVVSAIGASRDRVESDRLVRRLKADAQTFGITFSLEREAKIELPPYRGSTKLTFARPVT